MPPIVTLKELVEAGFHFGHRVSRWNPKMEPYIYGKRNLIHIINLQESIRGIIIARKFLTKICAQGKQVLFVGTKSQARAIVEREATRCGMHYVNERWLGGTLTNFATIRRRLDRLNELERMEADGSIMAESKKVQATLMREKRKLEADMRGLRNLTILPGALIIIDPRREKIAVAEARRLEIPTVALGDTDCDPDLVDILIPGNDDSIRAIEIVLTRLTDAILEGKAQAPMVPPKPEFEEAPVRPAPRARRARPTVAAASAGGAVRAGLPPASEGGGRGRRRRGQEAAAAAQTSQEAATGPQETVLAQTEQELKSTIESSTSSSQTTPASPAPEEQPPKSDGEKA